MRKFHRLVSFSCVFFVIMISQLSQAQDSTNLDITKIGIVNGDVFTFTLLRYNSPGSGFSLSQGSGEQRTEPIEIEEGDEFTVIVKSASPELDNSGNYSLFVTVMNGDNSADTSIPMVFGSLIIFTDWDYWEKEMSDQVSEYMVSTDEPPTFEVINGPEIFNATLEFIGEFSFFGTKTQFHITNEMHYNLTTGVLLYSATLVEIGSNEGIGLVEVIIAQNGYSNFDLPIKVINESSSDDSTPSFGVLISFSWFFVIITSKRIKNLKSES